MYGVSPSPLDDGLLVEFKKKLYSRLPPPQPQLALLLDEADLTDGASRISMVIYGQTEITHITRASHSTMAINVFFLVFHAKSPRGIFRHQQNQPRNS